MPVRFLGVNSLFLRRRFLFLVSVSVSVFLCLGFVFFVCACSCRRICAASGSLLWRTSLLGAMRWTLRSVAPCLQRSCPQACQGRSDPRRCGLRGKDAFGQDDLRQVLCREGCLCRAVFLPCGEQGRAAPPRNHAKQAGFRLHPDPNRVRPQYSQILSTAVTY